MPRFYWVTFILSYILGVWSYYAITTNDFHLILYMLVLLIIIYVNEKTSAFEDMLKLFKGKKKR